MSTEPTKPKVTPAELKTSGAAAPGRSKATTKPAAQRKPPRPPMTATTVAPEAPFAIVPASDEPGIVRADRVEIMQGGADRVEAGSVSVNQGGIGNATAQAIDVHQGGIGRARATDIAVSSGSIGLAQGDRVSLEMGAIGAAVGRDVRVTQAISGFVAARGQATVDQSLVSTLIGDHVTIRQPSAILVLIAGRVDGSVRPLLDWRGALAAGAVAGVVLGLLRLGRR
jgi:hypothetical protein